MLHAFGLAPVSAVWHPPGADEGEPRRMIPSLPLPLAADTDLGDRVSFSASKFSVLRALSTAPLHLDVIVARGGQGASATSAALLTLALEDVVVEGRPGFFRRRDSHNH